ncbi:hydrolase, TatD family [Hyphomonas neptunium ATCC 15444]|uniref:Hydrolase, TatD family n=2 Tax=Hyphomonas TaxID=85 RepID=Q0C178_HYPNA|nr:MULTISPECIES: TatD family hydrolase [Hyphomonas]ABI76537.1 hydrolase, TatD family [Hyphomonas neptunium ATCC 15444]KCZ95072.1 TatD family hydrolase [Hyphomonas hirschiana VP5]
MFDTHVNLHGEAFADDLQDVLGRAREAGVRRFLAICDRFDNFPAVHAIAKAENDMWCSVGTHPHHAKDFTSLTPEMLIDAAQDDKVVAIGETGLDFHYGYSPEKEQVASLLTHIVAARKTDLPLILHTREADDQMADILETEIAKGAFRPLLHCYTGGEGLAKRALACGAYFSVSGILSFKSAKDVRSVMSEVPMERIILETDCPYLAPVPMRGRRNEPAYLAHVAEALAALKGMPVDEVKAITEANALTLFSKVSVA